MTEEQKEHEAMKLVNLLHEMTRDGVVKPAVPGPDGTPVPMEHVLQLQEGAPNIGKLEKEDKKKDEDDEGTQR